MCIICSCTGTITRRPPGTFPCSCTVVQAVDADDPCLNVDCRDLFGWDKTLYAQLIDYPGEVIPLFDMETNAMANVWASRDLDGAIKVGFRAAGCFCAYPLPSSAFWLGGGVLQRARRGRAAEGLARLRDASMQVGWFFRTAAQTLLCCWRR